MGRVAAYHKTPGGVRRIRNIKKITEVETYAESSYLFSEALNTWRRPSTTYGGDLTLAKTNEGGILCVLSNPGIFREGTCESLELLLAQDDSVTEWQTINVVSNGGHCAVSRVGNKLYLCVTDKGVVGTREASAKLYVSPSGNGGDWEYYSTINSSDISGTTRSFESADFNGAGCITVLPDGRWLLPCGLFSNYQSHLRQNYYVWVSDDCGLNWVSRLFLTAYIAARDQYEQGCPKHVAVDTKGNLYISLGANQGGIDFKLYMSENNGDSWSLIVEQDTQQWLTVFFASNFEMLSSGDGGLYLYCDEYPKEPLVRIYKIEDPVNSPSFRTTIKDFSFEPGVKHTNPTMQIIDNKLLITRVNRVLCVVRLLFDRPRSLYVKEELDWRRVAL